MKSSIITQNAPTIVFIVISGFCLWTANDATAQTAAYDYTLPDGWMDSEIGELRKDPQTLTTTEKLIYEQVTANAFVWFTGTVHKATYEPYDEVANHFGTSQLKEVIEKQVGPTAAQLLETVFWKETLAILNAGQRVILYKTAQAYVPLISQYENHRISFVESIWAPKSGLPVDIDRVLSSIESLATDDVSFSLLSVTTFAELLTTLSTEQKEFFEERLTRVMTPSEMLLPTFDLSIVDEEIRYFSDTEKQALMKVCNQFWAWLTINPEDASLSGNGHTDYFGYPYYRDIDRAVILRSSAAQNVLNVLDENQKSILAGLVASLQKFRASNIEGREAFVQSIFSSKNGVPWDESNIAKLSETANQARIAEGRQAFIEALTYDYLSRSITLPQLEQLTEIRNSSHVGRRLSVESLSDEGKKMYTQVAAKAFVWFTGTFEEATYEPVGELANYFGFAKLRNEIRERGGPLADQQFRGVSWLETLEILDEDQRAILYELVDEQVAVINDFLHQRLFFVEGVWSGKQEGVDINFEDLVTYVERMGENEAIITVQSAIAYGKIIATLSSDQIAAFADIRSGRRSIEDMKAETANTKIIDLEMSHFTEDQENAMVAIGSKFISWLTGSLEDAVYLPSSKIANYFGFAYYRYIDRADVSRSSVADDFLGVINEDQKEVLAGLAESVVEPNNEYIAGRATIIRGAYPLKSGSAVDADTLIADYVKSAGIAEGKRTIIERSAFQYLNESLTQEQITELKAIRVASLND
ncbi:MAG: hypothetical protein MI748_20920 [Opitutales bacterium]|nr:hypothetical protein [Opitutales bacterium]